MAETVVDGTYSIPGNLTKGEIKELVDWLFVKGRYFCGGLDVRTKVSAYIMIGNKLTLQC
jgi:hypothetical protein